MSEMENIAITILPWVQAEWSSFQHSNILTDIPDVEIYKDGEGGKSSHSKPSQHEDVCQHDELKEEQMTTVTLLFSMSF